MFFKESTGIVKCSLFHGGFPALPGEGQERQLKKQIRL